MPPLTHSGDTLLPYFDANGDATVQTVKSSGGRLGFLLVSNPNATAAFIQFFDEPGAITVGTTVPKMSVFVPGSGSAPVVLPVPVQFVNSIKYACTTTATGSTALGVGLVVNAGYR